MQVKVRKGARARERTALAMDIMSEVGGYLGITKTKAEAENMIVADAMQTKHAAGRNGVDDSSSDSEKEDCALNSSSMVSRMW